ncbi:MAG: hypothetical protein J6X05_03935 [Bacteroidales bacterium]|nr:hypothetical protein [Bacteroidales bacterium]
MKKRSLSNSLLEKLKEGDYKEITEIVRIDPSLDMEMRGEDGAMVYYRGGLILTISENGLTGLDNEYKPNDNKEELVPHIANMLEYISRAKHFVDIHEDKINKLGEKEFQQRVVFENNRSVNAANTDYFIADVEWADNDTLKGRADIIAFRWNHLEHKKRLLQFTMIEVKQGDKAITDKRSGLKKHYDDFLKFQSDKKNFREVANDMLIVIKQKIELGLVKGLDYLFKNSAGEPIEPQIEDEPDFIILLANYHHYSSSLAKECEKLPQNCKFYLSSFMGYGLYKDFVFTKTQLQTIFPKIFTS